MLINFTVYYFFTYFLYYMFVDFIQVLLLKLVHLFWSVHIIVRDWCQRSDLLLLKPFAIIYQVILVCLYQTFHSSIHLLLFHIGVLLNFLHWNLSIFSLKLHILLLLLIIHVLHLEHHLIIILNLINHMHIFNLILLLSIILIHSLIIHKPGVIIVFIRWNSILFQFYRC